MEIDFGQTTAIIGKNRNISPNAKIGFNCYIAATAIIYDNVELGDNCIIEDFCIIGNPARGQRKGQILKIGENSHIRSHTIMYEGSIFGDKLMVGHHSMIREGIVAGKNLQIGSMNDLEGEATFGDWVRLHSNVHICRGTTIGDLTWIFPYVVTTNDPIPPSGLCYGPTIGAGVAVCTSSVVLPNTEIGDGAFIAAMTRAGGKIPVAALVVGNPGEIVGSVQKLRHKPTGKQHPWYNHHADAYPEEAQTRIAEIAEIVNKACSEFAVK